MQNVAQNCPQFLVRAGIQSRYFVIDILASILSTGQQQCVHWAMGKHELSKVQTAKQQHF
jgi:hypothetical protein